MQITGSQVFTPQRGIIMAHGDQQSHPQESVSQRKFLSSAQINKETRFSGRRWGDKNVFLYPR